MSDPFSAFDKAPRVSVVEGEIVLVGEGVCAAYTADAAREVALRLLQAVDAVERDAVGPTRTFN